MIMFKTLAVAAVAFASVLATSVGAVTLSSKDSVNLPAVITPMPAADAIIGIVDEAATGTIPGLRRDPFEGTALAGTTYTSIQGDASASYLTGPANVVSFIWGSPDVYNVVEFKLAGALVGSFDGTMGVRPPNGIGFANVVLTTGFLFDEIVFSSITNNAFEIANLSVGQVPLPAGVWLFISALGGLGLLARRRTA